MNTVDQILFFINYYKMHYSCCLFCAISLKKTQNLVLLNELHLETVEELELWGRALRGNSAFHSQGVS